MRRLLTPTKGVSAVSLVILSCLLLTACPVTTESASTAVNKYANTLKSFQDAEISLHNSAKVSDDRHYKIIAAEKTAALAGHELDAAIAAANAGGDITTYITTAQTAFNDLSGIVLSDPAVQQELQLTVQLAGDALKNAISLIQQLKAKAPTPAPAPAPTSGSVPHSGLLLWAMFLPMMAAAGIGLGSVLNLLQIITQLEPIAFDLILKLATSLKGKSTAEILALNESLFSEVEATADAELAKKPVVPPTK